MEKKNKSFGVKYLQFAYNTECFNKKVTSNSPIFTFKKLQSMEASYAWSNLT